MCCYESSVCSVSSSLLDFTRLNPKITELAKPCSEISTLRPGPLHSHLTQVYKNLYQAVVTTPNAFERPVWWREVGQKVEPGSRQVAPPRAKLWAASIYGGSSCPISEYIDNCSLILLSYYIIIQIFIVIVYKYRLIPKPSLYSLGIYHVMWTSLVPKPLFTPPMWPVGLSFILDNMVLKSPWWCSGMNDCHIHRT